MQSFTAESIVSAGTIREGKNYDVFRAPDQTETLSSRDASHKLNLAQKVIDD